MTGAARRTGLVRRPPGGLLFVGMLALLVVVIVLSFGIGPLRIPPGDVVHVIAHKLGLVDAGALTQRDISVVWNLRVPRALLAVIVGASLAMAGAGLQGLFGNPLADPGIDQAQLVRDHVHHVARRNAQRTDAERQHDHDHQQREQADEQQSARRAPDQAGTSCRSRPGHAPGGASSVAASVDSACASATAPAPPPMLLTLSCVSGITQTRLANPAGVCCSDG